MGTANLGVMKQQARERVQTHALQSGLTTRWRLLLGDGLFGRSPGPAGFYRTRPHERIRDTDLRFEAGIASRA